MAQRKTRGSRPPLTRERVLSAALELADAGGVESLSMRAVARRLGVEAMSLYHHVANKDAILDGLVDAVFEEIEVPAGLDWRATMLERALSARAALLRHRWAIGLMDSRRNPGAATLAHHDAVLGMLRGAGFSLPLTALAYSLLDSYIYGFTLQEVGLPFDNEQEAEEVAEAILERLPADALPHLAELTQHYVLAEGYSFADEFVRGLDLILDGLEEKLQSSC